MANVAAGRIGSKMKISGFFIRMSQFLRESYIEVVKKASWPSWSELKKSTVVVIVAVLIVACWIGGLDLLFGQISSPFFRAASPK